MIHLKYIQIALYGLDGTEEEARQPIRSFVDFINAKRQDSGYHGEPCIIDDHQERIPALLNLEGYSIQAGVLFLERLLKDGWCLYEINDFIQFIGKATNPKLVDSMEIMEFRLHRQ